MRKILLCDFLLLFITLVTLSGEEMALDVEKAVEKALANNLDLKSEKLNVKMKKRTKDTFWNLFLPTTTTSTTLYRSNEEPEGFSIPGIIEEPAPPRWEFSFSLSATLRLTSQLYFGIKKTFLDYEEGLISLETAQKRLALDVKKTFYNLILLQKNTELMQQNIETAERRYEQAKINYENGLVSEYDMLSAQVALENLKPSLKDMEIGYASALSAFKQLLGVDRKTDIRIVGSISSEARRDAGHPDKALELDADALIRGYVDNRLDIRALKHSIKSLDNLKNITFTSFFPSVTLSYLMDPVFQGDPFRDPWFADVVGDWEQKAGGFSVTLSLSLDTLIPNSQTQVTLKDNTDALRQAEISLAQARQGAEIEIETLVANLEKSIESIDTLRLNVRLAERAYNLAEEAYNAGSKELLEVQNADLELQKAKLEVLKEEYNYTVGLLDLEYAINAELDRVGKVK
jgi:outer membrane protein TolC